MYKHFKEESYFKHARNLFLDSFNNNKRDTALFKVFFKSFKKSKLNKESVTYLLKFQQVQFSTDRNTAKYLKRFDLTKTDILKNTKTHYKVHRENTEKYFVNKFKYFVELREKQVRRFL